MCVASTAKRRRRQAKNKYNHLAKKQRPNYKIRSAEIAARHNQKVWQAEQQRRARGG